MKQIFDSYERRARLYPMLLSLSPLLAGTLTLFPQWQLEAGQLVPAVIVLALAFLGSGIARDAGKRIEPRLFRNWGGIPTTQLLRHSNTEIDEPTKQRYHTFLGQHVTGLKLPTADAEQEDPAAADNTYRSAVNWLRDNTRDQKRFPLVFYENVNYGFRRNLLGLKWVAIIGAAIGVIPSAYYLAYTNAAQPAHLLALAFCVLALLAFATLVNEEFVRRAAFSYGMSLLAACDTMLGLKQPAKGRSNRVKVK
jgi:hypothetical protein